MNEWVAFGVVVVICGVLAALVRWCGDDQPPPPTREGDGGP